MGETLYETFSDWIGEHVEKENRDVRGRGPGGTDGLLLERNHHIHPLANEFPCRRLRGRFIGQVTEVPAEILAFLISQLLQPLSQSIQSRGNMVEAHVEEPDPIDSLRRLRLDSERRGEEAAGDHRYECAAFHH